MNDILRAHVALLGDGGQVAAAHRLDVSEATMSRWLAGTHIPNEGRAAAIAAEVGSDEATILAAISLARQLRHQAKKTAALKESENEALKAQTKRIEELEARLEALERRLKESDEEGPDERP